MAKVDLATLNKVKAEASQQIVKPKAETSQAVSKAGRPKKEAKNDQRVVLLLTKDEMEKYTLYCSQNGINRSSYLRYLLKQQNAI